MGDNGSRDNVSRMIGRLMQGRRVVVMNPMTAQREFARGISVRAAPDKPVADAIRELFELRREHALNIAPKLIPCPFPEPLIEYLYDQIRACLLFGLYSPAITMCGILADYSLKYCSYRIESNGSAEWDARLWDTFERDTFGMSIKRAVRNGLLTDESRATYEEFKDYVRNPYAHFNVQKLTRGLSFMGVRAVNTVTGQSREEEVPASSSPAFQMLALRAMDSRRALHVFVLADALVRCVFLKSSKRMFDQTVERLRR